MNIDGEGPNLPLSPPFSLSLSLSLTRSKAQLVASISCTRLSAEKEGRAEYSQDVQADGTFHILEQIRKEGLDGSSSLLCSSFSFPILHERSDGEPLETNCDVDVLLELDRSSSTRGETEGTLSFVLMIDHRRERGWKLKEGKGRESVYRIDLDLKDKMR